MSKVPELALGAPEKETKGTHPAEVVLPVQYATGHEISNT
jgi:hypothetical protein